MLVLKVSQIGSCHGWSDSGEVGAGGKLGDELGREGSLSLPLGTVGETLDHFKQWYYLIFYSPTQPLTELDIRSLLIILKLL